MVDCFKPSNGWLIARLQASCQALPLDMLLLCNVRRSSRDYLTPNYLETVLQQPQQHYLIISIGCWSMSRISSMFAVDKAALHTVLSVLCNFLGNDNSKVTRKNTTQNLNCIHRTSTLFFFLRSVKAQYRLLQPSSKVAEIYPALIMWLKYRLAFPSSSHCAFRVTTVGIC